MAQFESEALVLKQFDLGESDRIITFYTRNMGKVRAVARGVRKPKSKISGLVLPFSYNRVTFYRGRSLDRINHIESIYFFSSLREDLDLMAYASYMAELVEKVGMEDQANELLFSLLLTSFHQLIQVDKDNLEYVELIFNLRLLKILGFAPRLLNCVHCGSSVDTARKNYFDIRQGGIVCSTCHSVEKELTGESLQIMKKILGGFDSALKLKISERARQELVKLISSFLLYHLDLRLKSLDFLHMIKDLGEN